METITLAIVFTTVFLVISLFAAFKRIDKLEKEIEKMDESFDEIVMDLKNDLTKVTVDKGNKYNEPYGKYSFMCNGHRISVQQFVDIILDHLKIDIKKEGGLLIYNKTQKKK